MFPVTRMKKRVIWGHLRRGRSRQLKLRKKISRLRHWRAERFEEGSCPDRIIIPWRASYTSRCSRRNWIHGLVQTTSGAVRVSDSATLHFDFVSSVFRASERFQIASLHLLFSLVLHSRSWRSRALSFALRVHFLKWRFRIFDLRRCEYMNAEQPAT